MTWYEWKAQELNRILHAPEGQGITAATVKHGERNTSHKQTFLAQGMSKAQLRRTNKRQWQGLRSKSA